MAFAFAAFLIIKCTMITTCPAPEPLLFSLMSSGNELPLQLSRDLISSSGSDAVFSWSDFPCHGDDPMMECEYVPPPPRSSPTRLASFCSQEVHKRGPPPSPRSSVQHDLDSVSCYLPAPEAVIVRKPGKRVSFSPVLHVRTHSVILGNHPCCSGGMALQCGWESAEEKLINFERHEARHSPKRRMADFRLSYAQRRERLQELTGLIGCELLQEEYKLFCCNSNNDVSRSNCGRSEPVVRCILHHAPTLRQLATSLDE